ncbi:non-ribosomal peptide synthetase component F [Nocardiopsis mwathae]|uniref:Non-ribosomal peptide synthetase component F n=1 Tax=Nocardiopsis mwathae TaxID=1472723 RepID=A0A7W9YHN3_9ACTN|nr:AMP-binding protein [Nocardiopsis mwathae]MBB6171386.1 non-ribosomal peptide synthetase component F [Nocardiopsis mwathae]
MSRATYRYETRSPSCAPRAARPGPPHRSRTAERAGEPHHGGGIPVLPFAADDAGLTIAEIDATVDRLVRDLTALGAGPGTEVAVALPRSPGLVLALVAVMRTGATHIALDPDHPDRAARALADAAPVCAVCTAGADAAEGIASLLTAGPGERNNGARPGVRPFGGRENDPACASAPRQGP